MDDWRDDHLVDTQLRVLGISGSLRKASLNTALIDEAVRRGPAHGLSIEKYEIGDLPLFNPDLEAGQDPPVVRRLKEAVANADGLLLATPEYNHSVTPALKNAIDWAARKQNWGDISPMVGKPIAILGSGGRAGSARSQLHLRQILAETKSLTMVTPTLHVERGSTKFSPERELSDATAVAELDALLAAFSAWIGLVRPR